MENLDRRVWEFLQDDRFIKWVHAPDEDTIAWWEKWMASNPDEVNSLFKAREIARDLAYTGTPADADLLSEQIWSDMQASLDDSHSGEPAEIKHVFPVAHKKIGWYWAAACLAVLAGIGAGIAILRSSKPSLPVTQQVASRVVEKLLERTNDTKANVQVCLVDGSRITLQPGAGIRHAIYLQKDKREVYLEGNAFFEIAKDADRPFYVYTKDLVVRVLGTSFKVITNKANGDIAVLVETGKVSVSRKTNPSIQQLILEPNQQALYKAQTRDLVGSAADKKELAVDMRPAAPAIPFSFEEIPVVELFKDLENAYGIPFHYDEKVFSSCVVTTSLGNETLEEKLKIVCTAIGATWKVGTDGIAIDGKPCK